MYALQQVHDLSSNEHKKQEQQTATDRDLRHSQCQSHESDNRVAALTREGTDRHYSRNIEKYFVLTVLLVFFQHMSTKLLSFGFQDANQYKTKILVTILQDFLIIKKEIYRFKLLIKSPSLTGKLLQNTQLQKNKMMKLQLCSISNALCNIEELFMDSNQIQINGGYIKTTNVKVLTICQQNNEIL